MFKDKKGISAVVATILIIMVAIIAVITLWTTLRPQLEAGAKQVGTAQECFYLSLKIDSAEYAADGTLTLKVARDAGKADLVKVQIIVEGSSQNATPEEVPEELEKIEYTLTETLSNKPDEIEIAGLLRGDVTCPISDTAKGDEIVSV